jgi:hypothetical protein
MDYRTIGLFISVIILFVSGLFLFRWMYGTGNDIVGVASICGTIMSVSALFMFVTMDDIQGFGHVLSVVAGAGGEAAGNGAASSMVAFIGRITETHVVQTIVKHVVKAIANGTILAALGGSLALLAASGGATAFAGGGSLATAFAASLVALTGTPIAMICVFGMFILASYGSVVDAVSAERAALSPGELMFGNRGTMEQMDEGGRRKKRGKKSRR